METKSSHSKKSTKPTYTKDLVKFESPSQLETSLSYPISQSIVDPPVEIRSQGDRYREKDSSPLARIS